MANWKLTVKVTKSKYGIDLKKYGQLTSIVLDCKKI